MSLLDLAHDTAEEIAEALRRYRLPLSTERALQDGIAEVLVRETISFEREASIGPGERPDFMVGPLCVEVKIQGATAGVKRQLARYAKHDRVAMILLVTTHAIHGHVPNTIEGKPVKVLRLSVIG